MPTEPEQSTMPDLRCAYCDGILKEEATLREGYENCKDDPDAYAYYFSCVSCAGTTGWSKTKAGAVRIARMRPFSTTKSTLEETKV